MTLRGRAALKPASASSQEPQAFLARAAIIPTAFVITDARPIPKAPPTGPDSAEEQLPLVPLIEYK